MKGSSADSNTGTGGISSGRRGGGGGGSRNNDDASVASSRSRRSTVTSEGIELTLDEERQRALRGASVHELQSAHSRAYQLSNHHHHHHNAVLTHGAAASSRTSSSSSNTQSELRQRARAGASPNASSASASDAAPPLFRGAVAAATSSSASSGGGSGVGSSSFVNPYYADAAARESEDMIRSFNEQRNPETAPVPPHEQPCSLSQGSGWSLVQTTQGRAGGAPPCERSLHTGCVLNGVFYVFGGYDGSTRVNDFHAYSFAEKRWSPVMPSSNSGRPPSPRDRHVSVVHGNSLFIQGGFDGTSRVQDFFGFDFSSMCWREILPLQGRPPSERHSHAAVVYGHKMFVYGGYDGSYKSDLHEYSFCDSKWSPVQTSGRRPRARYRATCVCYKSNMLLFGGHDGTRHLSDTHVFDFDTRTWSALLADGPSPTPRDSHVSVVHSNSLYVFGGSSGSAMNDLHELQLSGGTTVSRGKWRQIKSPSSNSASASSSNSSSTVGEQPTQRFCHVAVVHEDSMFVFGGYDGSDRLNDFWRFDFAAYDLTFEVPPSTIITDLRHLVNDDKFSDITFIVEDQEIYAHKMILMRCSYFRALFLGSMRESQESTVRLEQVSHPIFLSVLEYLYTDQVHVSLEQAMELFQAADIFCIPRLKVMCERRMLQSITVENAATIFYAADMHSASMLRAKALKFIMNNFEDVSKTKAFEEMGRMNMDLVFEVLHSR